MAQSHIALRASAARRSADIRAARCGGFFPLTRALSVGERVHHSLRGGQSRPVGFPLPDAPCSLSLGERARVRGNGVNVSERWLVPNLDGKSWDLLQIYFK